MAERSVLNNPSKMTLNIYFSFHFARIEVRVIPPEKNQGSSTVI